MRHTQLPPKIKKLHATIHSLINVEIVSNVVSYNRSEPYQSYERIQFEGLRWSVEKRIREYGLEQFFNPNSVILDIGANFGFFVCEFAMHCREVHGVEPNPHLIKIGEATAAHLGVSEKVRFFDVKFEDFEGVAAYDVIFSLAAFFTQDGRERSDAASYFGRINKLLQTDGQMFYESTSYTKDPSDPHFKAQQESIEYIEKAFSETKSWETTSGSEGHFRRFAIGRKNA